MALRPNFSVGLPLSRNPAASGAFSFCRKHGMRLMGCQGKLRESCLIQQLCRICGLRGEKNLDREKEPPREPKYARPGRMHETAPKLPKGFSCRYAGKVSASALQRL